MGPKGDDGDGGKITSFFKPRPKADHGSDERPALAEKPSKASNKRKLEADPSVTEVKEKLQKLGSEVSELVSGMGQSWLEALEVEVAKPYFTSLRCSGTQRTDEVVFPPQPVPGEGAIGGCGAPIHGAGLGLDRQDGHQRHEGRHSR